MAALPLPAPLPPLPLFRLPERGSPTPPPRSPPPAEERGAEERRGGPPRWPPSRGRGSSPLLSSPLPLLPLRGVAFGKEEQEEGPRFALAQQGWASPLRAKRAPGRAWRGPLRLSWPGGGHPSAASPLLSSPLLARGHGGPSSALLSSPGALLARRGEPLRALSRLAPTPGGVWRGSPLLCFPLLSSP